MTLAVLLAVPALVVSANLWVFGSGGAHMYVDSHRVPARPIAIVPGTKVDNGVPSVALHQRLAAALSLYKAGKVRTILVSGNRRDDSYDEPAAMVNWLVAHGVPAGDVVPDPAGFRTLDTMQRASRIYGVTKAIICSQGTHIPRAVFLAHQAGIDAVGLVVDPQRSVHVMSIPHETIASALAVLDTLRGRGPRVLGPPAPIDGDLRTTAALRQQR